MKFILLFYLSILLNQISIISNISPEIFIEEKESEQFNAVYRVDSKEKGYPLTIDKGKVQFSSKKGGKEQNFRIIPAGTNKNSYYIIAKSFNKKIGINDNGDLILYNLDDLTNIEKTRWNFIKIEDKKYFLQNAFNKKYMEVKNRKEGKNTIYYPICSSNLTKENEKIDIDKISNTFKYSFFKLCDEVKLKPEHIEIIDKEPVDILIKYIDLTDKNLNREGITQIKKDEDNEELRYSVRSILQYVPWVRKIFILMPNEKVKYFKPIEEISGKFVYVKDKDLLGFDSANSVVFQLNLQNMTKFGLSENFILMDDDYFFGKPVKKSDFFYYDEKLKKVVPSVLTDDFSEMVKSEVLNEYNKLWRRKNAIKPHTFNGWKISQLSAFKLLLEQYDIPFIFAGFSHNAISLNINDLKEIYDLVINKYGFANDCLKSKIRTIYDLQPQSLFNAYNFNIKKRLVNSIPYAYYDVAFLDGKNLDIELFVLNTSGDRKYTAEQQKKAKNLLEKKFPLPTPFEDNIDYTKIDKKTQKEIDLNEYVKKNEYDILKKNFEEIEKKNKELNDKIEEITKSKEKLEKNLKDEIKYLLDNIESIKKMNPNNTLNIINNNTKDNNDNKDNKDDKDNKNINQENSLKKYTFIENFFKIILFLLLFILFISFFCYLFKFKYNQISNDFNERNEIPLNNIINNNNETFTKLSTKEKF